jgi:hypothetical protein
MNILLRIYIHQCLRSFYKVQSCNLNGLHQVPFCQSSLEEGRLVILILLVHEQISSTVKEDINFQGNVCTFKFYIFVSKYRNVLSWSKNHYDTITEHNFSLLYLVDCKSFLAFRLHQFLFLCIFVFSIENDSL